MKNLYFFYLLLILFKCVQSDMILAQPAISSLVDTVLQKGMVTIKNNQDVVIETYQSKDGKKHGMRKKYSNSGNVILEEQYKNDFLHGKKMTYDNFGNIKTIENYKFLLKENKSVLNGMQERYSNKNLISTVKYKNGIKEGGYKLFYDNGLLKEEGQYLKNLKTGKNNTYDIYGNLRREENFAVIIDEQGRAVSVLNGKVRYYFNNNRISSDLIYKSGKKNGLCMEYYDGAENILRTKAVYKDDLKHGSYTNYRKDGKIEQKGIYYQEIKVGDTIYKNAYDGEIIHYHPNGAINRIERWQDFKKEGIWEKYYENGQLNLKTKYESGLKTGHETQWDINGNKIAETVFEIISENGIKKSVKQGVQSTWKNGVLSSVTTYKNDLRNGLHKTYYPDGTIEREINFENDSVQGKNFSYYEDGKLKYEHNYRSTRSGNHFIGWNKSYDENGELTREFYANGSGKNLVLISYEDQHKRELVIDDVLKINYHPQGELMSLHILNASSVIFGYDFYSNQTVRRVHFFNADYSPKTAGFAQDGTLLQVLSNNGHIEEEKVQNEMAIKLFHQVSHNWNSSELITSGLKNGKYQLQYANGKTFMDIEFIEGLPQGKWTIFDAVSNDTIFYAEFEKGKRVGKWIKKRNEGISVVRRLYDKNEQLLTSISYFSDGSVKEENHYNNQERIFSREYYADFRLKHEFDNINKSFVYYKENGYLLSADKIIVEQDSIRVKDTYYSNINQLREKRTLNLRTKAGFVDTYHENGVLKTHHDMLDEKPDGKYKQYNENGNLIAAGEFKTGKKSGRWVKYNEQGNISEEINYENGEQVIDPEKEKECACYDKSLPNDQIKYVPALSSLTDYKAVAFYFPKFIVPRDSFNYDYLFYMGFHGNITGNNGYASMKLLSFDELSFYIPANKHLRISLTPCRLGGYFSNIESTFNFSKNKLVSASLNPKRIAISLEKNPLTTKEGGFFTGYFDTDALLFSGNEINIRYKKEKNSCFTSGLINDFMEVIVLDADLILRHTPGYRRKIRTEGFPVLKNEANNFNGFFIHNANVSFDLTDKSETIRKVYGTSGEMVAGSNWIAAEINIEGKMTDKNTFVTKRGYHTVFVSELKQLLKDKRFYRIEINYVEQLEVLRVRFFTEK